MRTRLCAVLAVLLAGGFLLAASAPARADVFLGSSTTSVDLPVWVGGLTASPSIVDGANNGFTPFGEVYFYGGTPPVTSSAGDPYFFVPSLVLTNGMDDSIGLFFDGAYYGMQLESVALTGPSVTGPDFAGHEITSMTLVQDYWQSWADFGTDPWTLHTDIVYTISYFGPDALIAEPVALGLLGLAMLGLRRKRGH